MRIAKEEADKLKADINRSDDGSKKSSRSGRSSNASKHSDVDSFNRAMKRVAKKKTLHGGDKDN